MVTVGAADTKAPANKGNNIKDLMPQISSRKSEWRNESLMILGNKTVFAVLILPRPGEWTSHRSIIAWYEDSYGYTVVWKSILVRGFSVVYLAKVYPPSWFDVKEIIPTWVMCWLSVTWGVGRFEYIPNSALTYATTSSDRKRLILNHIGRSRVIWEKLSVDRSERSRLW